MVSPARKRKGVDHAGSEYFLCIGEEESMLTKVMKTNGASFGSLQEKRLAENEKEKEEARVRKKTKKTR